MNRRTLLASAAFAAAIPAFLSSNAFAQTAAAPGDAEDTKKIGRFRWLPTASPSNRPLTQW
ncbi:hypothetical protein [Rhizobium ruizarguesonis]|uniref:hypothetical protein n=1 Tax=Rhizobium ruizarguesonis TaxID=2081791 RepID=UPI0010315A7A|nr:hypothetical protein [Rhizobium ruizarguesonis]TAU57459.1 hypothetical protein ELI46_39650 [Rhizobium ruizarguesonis]